MQLCRICYKTLHKARHIKLRPWKISQVRCLRLATRAFLKSLISIFMHPPKLKLCNLCLSISLSPRLLCKNSAFVTNHYTKPAQSKYAPGNFPSARFPKTFNNHPHAPPTYKFRNFDLFLFFFRTDTNSYLLARLH